MGKKRTVASGGARRSQAEAHEIDDLERRIQELDAVAESNDGSGEAGTKIIWNFDNLPISQHSLDGLRAAKYTRLTAIQRAALPHTLAGKDVLGAAKTGSGKTLAFLIPVVEKLFRLKWSRLDGLGALIISPTRELAMQIFDELRKVGARHDLSAGLLIGGKNVKEERERINAMNILVCTPGRLLQHMDETPGFDASALQLLVLDEADRILDMGFSASVNAILENLPRRRQTMLFSATQTKSVKDLARLSLRDPTYIAVHAEAVAPTPVKLQQAYVVCELQDKHNVLWAFMKAHLKAKMLVFLTTGKQVKFALEAFRRLRPGVVLRALHGKMKQMKRMAVYYDFCQAKGGCVLFATDIAARGLDFPTVDWVLQVDCPEDVASYIHRVGRTARYTSGGKSLMMLLPSEKEAMLKQLEGAKVPLKPLKINPKMTQPVSPALQALLSKNNELKELAQRALVAYVRSVFLQPNKAVFDASALPAAEYALSLGLTSVPKLRFLKRHGPQKGAAASGIQKHASQSAGKEVGVEPAAGQQAGSLSAAALGEAESDSEGISKAETSSDQSPGQKGLRGLHAAGRGSKRSRTGVDDEQDDIGGGPSVAAAGLGSEQGVAAAEEDDFLVVKRRDIYDAAPPEPAAVAPGTEPLKQQKKKQKLRISKASASGSRVVFDEDGHAQDPLAQLSLPEETGRDADLTAAERFDIAREGMRARDAADRVVQREARRQKKAARKERSRARAAAEAGAAAGPQLARPDDASSEEEYGSDGRAMEGASSSSDAEDARLQAVPQQQQQQQQRPRPPARPEVAHMGMQTHPEAVLGHEHRQLLGLNVVEASAMHPSLTIAEQERLAMQLLSQRELHLSN
ncbi:hypothetical protein CVIRNUC_009635 [Coccomyxa viridis]|uniref:ATP-dependent RNA helicase n=1 Tax=Coccomyxa viridis TaxID=1274662 RepID=A0AAV1IGW2_9CHLO|nr:hypothetical protein CVIRNUC_009635 [Coccomyxa viridis]